MGSADAGVGGGVDVGEDAEGPSAESVGVGGGVGVGGDAMPTEVNDVVDLLISFLRKVDPGKEK